MKKGLIALVIAGAFTAPIVAQADVAAQSYIKDKLSVSTGYKTIDIDGLDGSMGVGSIAAEYKLHERISIEGEMSRGLVDAEMGGVTVDLAKGTQVALKGNYPLTGNVAVLGEVAYYTTEIEADDGVNTVTAEDDGWVYTAGLQYSLHSMNVDLSAKISDNAEYEDDETYTLGAVYNFARSPISAGVEFTQNIDRDMADEEQIKVELAFKF